MTTLESIKAHIAEMDTLLAAHIDKAAALAEAEGVEALGDYLEELDRSVQEWDDAALKLLFWSKRITGE